MASSEGPTQPKKKKSGEKVKTKTNNVRYVGVGHGIT
jgi:hypothetical protein